jgi:hypothetical protein
MVLVVLRLAEYSSKAIVVQGFKKAAANGCPKSGKFAARAATQPSKAEVSSHEKYKLK